MAQVLSLEIAALLTAAHVIEDSEQEDIVAMFANPESGWFGFRVSERETHPTEDVAIIRLEGVALKSFLRISSGREHSSCKYRLFGYPEDAAYEKVVMGRAVLRPDLVYNEGYIRRRIEGPIPAIRGKSFYELSEVAGTGSSGAPVTKFTRPVWEVIGIYVGHKTNDRATSVSYAVREETFRDWIPRCLGATVLDESQNVAA